MQGQLPPGEMEANHDPWTRLHSVVRQVNTQLIKCVKIPAHEDPNKFSQVLDRWIVKGNDLADQEAAKARDDYAHELRTLWEERISEHEQQCRDRKVLHAHFVKIGTRAVIKGSTHSEALDANNIHVAVPNIATGEEEEAFPLLFTPLPSWTDSIETMRLGPCGPEVRQWMTQLTTQEDSRPEWVSMYQLLISFQLSTG